MSNDSKRVVVSKSAADRWIQKHVSPEYRVDIYPGSHDLRKMYSKLKSFRDASYKMGSLEPVRDLGIIDHGDRLTIWSSDHGRMLKLCSYLESRGFETSGIW